MALQKTTISFPTQNGIDTKNAPALVDGSKFALLQNAVFDKGTPGQLHKRNGYTQLTPFDNSGAPITNGQALAVFNQSELDLIAQNQFYAQSGTSDVFIPKGTVVPMGVSERAIAQSFYNQLNADGAIQGGVGVYAWEDGRGGVWATVINEATGTIFLAQRQLSATGSCPKVISNGSLIYILMSNALGQILAFQINPANPTAIPSGTVTGMLGSANCIFDIAVANGHFFAAVATASGFTVYLLSLTTMVVSASSNVSSSSVTAICVAPVGTAAFVGIGENGAGYAYFYTIPGLAQAGPFGSFTAQPSNVSNITAYALSVSSVQCYYQQEPTATADRFIGQFQVNFPGTFSSTGVLVRGVGLASQPLINGSAVYLLVSYPSATDQTYFLLNTSGVVVGKFFVTSGGPFSTHSRLPAWQGSYSLAVLEQVFNESVAGKLVNVTSVSELTLNFAYSTISTAQLGQTLLVASGGMTQEYDGAALTEAAFNVPPPPPSVATYYASNISILNTVGTAAPGYPLITTITIPQTADNSGVADATLIIPGEWFCINAADTPSSAPTNIPGTNASYVWFNVGGVGNSPAISGYTGYEVSVSATATAAQITSALYAVLNTIPNVAGPGEPTPVEGFALSQTSATSLQLVANGLQVSSLPSMSTIFNAGVVNYGSVSSLGYINFNIPPGYMFQPGQNIQLTGFPASIYFTVDGYGDFPIVPEAEWVLVAINSTDSAQTVASKIVTALTAIIPASAFGNQVTINATGDGAITAPVTTVGTTETYSYLWVYERIDAQGQLEQSTPSTPLTLLLPSMGPLYIPPMFNIIGTTLRLTQKSYLDLALYRTIGNGPVFYRCSPVYTLTTLINSTTTDYVTFNDQVTDALLLGNVALYNTNGVTDNASPVAFNWLAVSNDRVWGISSENTQNLWFSSKWQPLNAVSWSSAQIETLEPTGGQGKGIKAMDGTLAAFQERNIYTFAGDGPDVTGNGSFSGPTLVCSGVGCRDPGSMVLTLNGIIFKGDKGPWLLDRSFQVSQVGRDVWAYNADIVTATSSIPYNTQIRMLSSSGTTLMFDYAENAWGTFTNHQGVSSVVFNGSYCYLNNSGQIMTENPGSYLDGSVGFPMLIQTSWLKLDGNIQNFKRIWRMFFLGNFPNTNPIQVQAAFNYISTVVDTQVWNASAGNNAPVWGADPVWGSSSPWGGVDASSTVQPSVLQIRYDPSVQLCESIQLTLTDLTPYPASQTWGLNAIDFEVGLRKGGFKIGVPQRVG